MVDDAIVMTENIYIHHRARHDAQEADIEEKEIFAVISTSVTAIAVFFPIVFMEA